MAKNAKRTATVVITDVELNAAMNNPDMVRDAKADASKIAANMLGNAKTASAINPALIRVMPGFNVRYFNSKTDDLDRALKASIKANGIENPLTVRVSDGVCFVVSGHRRLAAVMELIAEGVPFKTVPVVREREDRTDLQRTMSLWTSNDGKPLSALERGQIILRLRDYGWEDKDIAEKFGISIRYIGELMAGQKMSKALQTLVQEGKASFTSVIEIAKQVKSETMQAALAMQLRKNLLDERKEKAGTADVQKAAGETGADVKQAKSSEKAKATKATAKAKAAAAENPATAASFLSGPFDTMRDAIRAADGLEIGTGATIGIAAEIARLLTYAVKALGTVAAEPVAEPATPEPAETAENIPVDAADNATTAEPATKAARKPRKAVPVPAAPMASHGKAKATSAAPSASSVPVTGKRGRKAANA